MSPLFKKLQYKGSEVIVCMNAPESFDAELSVMQEHATVVTNPASVNIISFAIVFVTTQARINEATHALLPRLSTDAPLWFCYPKGSSKKYKCDFNRDNGWQVLGDAGFEGVRMVAIDEDWSALRFRKVEHIKTLTRRESFAVSKEAKARTTGKNK